MKRVLSYLILITAPLLLHAQTAQDTALSKTIQVYSEYKPQISDAVRISVNPKVYDTLDLQVNLKYNLSTTPLNTDYHLIPLKAVSVKGDRLSELYRGELVAGLGNYMTGLFTVRYMTERSRIKQTGIEFSHHGSAGKIKKENDTKVHAGYMTDYVSAYWKRFFENFTTYASIKPQYQSVLRYGASSVNSGGMVVESDTVFEKKDVRRNILGLSLKGGIVSKTEEDDDLQYAADLAYDLSHVNPSNMENLVVLSGSLGKQLERMNLGLESSFSMSAIQYDPVDSSMTRFQSALHVFPYIQFGEQAWRLKAGVNVAPLFGSTTAFKLFPDALFSYSLPGLKMIPYVHYSGGTNLYSMRSMLEDNPYVKDNEYLRPSVTRMKIDLGLDGRLKKLITYNAAVSFSLFDDLYFWNIERGTPSVYTAVYDNGNLWRVHGDMGFLFRKLTFLVDLNYYHYTLDNMKHPWNRPVFDLTVAPRIYIIHPSTNKTKLTVEPRMYIETLWQDAKAGDDGEEAKSSIVDVGLEIDYSYNSVLNFFVDVNNMLGIRYYRYADYLCQRANFLIGLSYSFGGHKE